MVRKAREKSSTGIYHVMVRGINQQDIFEDDNDRMKYIEMVDRYKKETGFELYAYCLMGNHIHLLIREYEVDLSQIMKKLGTSYASYYNWKHERVGHLFQDRYRSERVESDGYFLTAVRYIHQNPVKVGLSDIQSYRWSSYKSYITDNKIVDVDFLLGMFSEDKENAIKQYTDFMNESSNDRCLEFEYSVKMTDEKAKEIIKEMGHIKNITDIQKLDRDKRNEILKRVKEQEDISVLQIARVTGLNRKTINRI